MSEIDRALDELMLPRNPEERIARIEQLIADSKETERLREAIPIVTDGRFDADSALAHIEMWREENA